MDRVVFLQEIVPSATAVLVAAVVSLVLALIVGVMGVTRGRPNALFGGVVLGPVGLVAAGLSMWSASGIGPSDAEASLSSFAAILGTSLFAFALGLFPVGFHALLASVAGARHAPRRWWAAGLGAVLVLVTVALPVVGTSLVGNGELVRFGILRAVTYALVGVVTVPALLGGVPDSDESEACGPEPGANAALGFAMFVALGEGAGRAAAWFLLLDPFLARDSVERRIAFVDEIGATFMDPATTWSLVTVAVGLGVGLVGLASVALQPGARRMWALAGLLWLAVPVAVALTWEPPRQAWYDLAQAVPLPVVDAPADGTSAPPE